LHIQIDFDVIVIYDLRTFLPPLIDQVADRCDHKQSIRPRKRLPSKSKEFSRCYTDRDSRIGFSAALNKESAVAPSVAMLEMFSCKTVGKSTFEMASKTLWG
jgi:hypothetical protein